MKIRLFLIGLILFVMNSISVSAERKLQILSYDWGEPKYENSSAKNDTLAYRFLKYNIIHEYAYNEEGHLEKYALYHEKRIILKDKGVDLNNTLSLYPGYDEDFFDIKVRYISSNGNVKNYDKSNFLKEKATNGEIIYKLAVEGVEVGGIVEFVFREQVGGNYYSSVNLQKQYNVDSSKISIISPINLVFKSKSYNGYPELTETVDSTNECRIISACDVNMKSLQRAPVAFYNSHLKRVEYSLSLNKVNGIKFRSNLQKVYEEITNFDKKELKKLASLWKKMNITSNMTEEEKVKAIELYIKKNITYINDDVKGYDLTDFATIIKTSYANEKGYFKLFAATFLHFEIPFEVVVTCDRHQKEFDPDFDADNFIKDFLFYFPNLNNYIDVSSNLMRFGFFNSNFISNKGFVLKVVSMGGMNIVKPNVITIPVNDYKKSYHNTNAIFKLNPQTLNADYSVDVVMAGYSSSQSQIYYFYSKPDQQKEMIESFMESDNVLDKMADYTVENYSQDDWFVNPFTIKAKFSGNRLITKAGSDILIKIGRVIGRQEEMYQKEKRELPVENNFARSYDRNIVFEIPNGFKVSNLNDIKMHKELKKDGQICALFDSNYKIDGNKLTIIVKEYYKDVTYEISDFETYRSIINASADFYKLTLVLEKK